MKNFNGSHVALVTPMHEDGTIDWEATSKLIEWHISSGTNSILAVGTTGESPTLSHEEHNEFIRYSVDKVAGRIPVIAGTGSNSTAEAISLSQYAQDVGVDAALSVVPYYNRPTQQGLIRHFTEITKNSDLPHFLYNVPARTVADILPETVAELSTHKNIIGIKEATGDVSRVARLKSMCDKNFILLSGDDDSCCEFMLAGGDGCMSVTANIAPAVMSKLCNLATAGEDAAARKLQEELMPIHQALSLEPNPIPVKYALFLKKQIAKGIRLPLTQLTDENLPQLEKALELLDVIGG